MNIEISRFEQLPNEILLDLFENYIRLIDIYSSFNLLNNGRINSIIKIAQYYINIPSKDIFHIKTFSYFSNQIVSLYITMFCDDLDLTKLINLRVLHIEKPTRTQLMSISEETLPKLYYLSLSPCWYSIHELPKHLTNLSTDCHFKYLRFCILPDKKIIRFPLKIYDQI